MNTEIAGISQEQVQQVLKAISEVDGQPEMGPARYRCSSGVVLKLKKVPPFLLRDVQSSFRPPRVPKVYLEDKESSEDNPNDPDYVQAVREYNMALGDAINGVMLVRGTEIEAVPEGVSRPESNEWVEDLQDLPGVGENMIDVPTTPRRRYYCWLKYVALTDSKDLTGLLKKLSELAGNTLEVDVAQAVESFRDNEAGDTADGVRPASQNGLGTPDQSASGTAGLRA